LDQWLLEFEQGSDSQIWKNVRPGSELENLRTGVWSESKNVTPATYGRYIYRTALRVVTHWPLVF